MQLISLNVWGARIAGITPFLVEKSRTTDIFCLQEVYNNAPSSEVDGPDERVNFFCELEERLADFDGHFTAQVEGVGMAIFIRKKLKVGKFESHLMLSEGEVECSEFKYPRFLQHIAVSSPKLSVYNFHGVPGDGKRDNPERELQSNRLLNIIKKDNGPKILVGDFNLNPDTKLISELGKMMQNPLTLSGFNSTRSRHYKKLSEMPFADYAFLSHDLKIDSFRVLLDEVSDHLALEVNFE